MSLSQKRIISVATTGSWPTKRENPNVPISPEEIAEDIYQCFLAGASIAHIHVRDEAQRPSMNPAYFLEIQKQLAKHKDCNIILNFTTSGGVSWSEEQRLDPVRMGRPEMASFDCGSMNWQHRMIFQNHPEFLSKLGLTLLDWNIKPEVEVFDSGMIEEAKYYIMKGVLKPPVHFQFCLGVPGGAQAKIKELIHFKELLPEGSTWSAFGVGKGALEILYGTIALGGHVRVGMEDNIRFSKDTLATGNVQFVKRAKNLIETFGYQVATPDEAREILSIRE